MKRLAYILAAATLVLAACTKESFQHPSEAGIPSASAYNPVVTVDQSTNQVTFSVDEKGIIPVWVLPDKEGKWTEYKTGNPYKRIYASAGDYAVRFHADAADQRRIHRTLQRNPVPNPVFHFLPDRNSLRLLQRYR